MKKSDIFILSLLLISILVISGCKQEAVGFNSAIESKGNAVIKITADDYFILYVNGVYSPPNGNSWHEVYLRNLDLMPGSNVITILAGDQGGDEGVLFELTYNGLIAEKSDKTWKAKDITELSKEEQNKLIAEINNPTFDDSNWEPVTENMKKTLQQRPKGFYKANWIWGKETKKGTVYAFRKVTSSIDVFNNFNN